MKGALFCIGLMVASPALDQALPPVPEGVHLSGSVRLRYETISGQARAGVPADEASTQLRTILKASYRSGPLSIGGELWDSRALDAANPTALSTNEVDAFELTHAWIAYDLGTAGKGWNGRITAGRMSLDLGSRRLIARDDYRNTNNAFTGVRVDWGAPGKVEGTLIYVLPEQRLPENITGIRHNRVEFDHEGFDTRLWGGRASKAGILGPTIIDGGVYRFEERDTPTHATRDRHLTAIDLRWSAPVRPGKVDFEIEGIRQSGSISASLAANAARLPVEAWFGHARLGYQWRGPWQPRVAIEGDYASGDHRHGTYGRFDTLYAMRRADFSPAGLYNAISRSNLVSIGPRLEVTPDKRWDAFGTVKKLWLASAVDGFATTGVVDPTGRSGHDGGWQIDARVRYWAIPKRLQLEIDGDWLTKGRFLQTAPNRASAADTKYLSLNAQVFF
ncbi:alginate export family protein [Sphingomonas sp. GlSt437]|uniref:alginate export family protein n=1 Tax=Sphingomonas sp. GlSt437 TaxID=3389970 RepID=UPI003A897D69